MVPYQLTMTQRCSASESAVTMEERKSCFADSSQPERHQLGRRGSGLDNC